MNDAFQWDNKILVEKGVNAREIEFSVIGNDKPEVICPGEIRPRHEFYSYEAKYIDSDGAELLIPAEIDPELTEKMKKIAVNGISGSYAVPEWPGWIFFWIKIRIVFILMK